jgi:nickel-type superoxide dismutase maturation protease
MRPARMVATLLVLAGLVAAHRRLDVVEVRGRSMAPALLPGDRLVVVRASPRVGDVVLARDPRHPARELVKRVARLDDSAVELRGDNPAFSTDARTFGSLTLDAVTWRAVARYWPPGRVGRIPANVRLALVDEGGEAACAVPEALVAG